MFDRKEWNKTPKGKKCNTINAWKCRGLKESKEFIDQIYEEYLNSEECQLCGEPYSEHNRKEMEHNHLTGEFRNICCKRCNMWKTDKAVKNITWDKDSNKYRVQIKRNYKNVLNKFYKTEEECKEVLNQFIIDNPHWFT
tara:strand:+ start:179 stop:595 length:417 start_codon:yes stop_codon:yes gene_type:complete